METITVDRRIIIKAPNNPYFLKRIFLAGSIEMGKAENWQERIEKAFKNLPVVILNPRRDDWDISWAQSLNNPNFVNQVEWELKMMEKADEILMYFDITTKSPITLLELGLFAHSRKLAVCCPNGFWQKGNVDVVCKYYNIPIFECLNELINWSLKDYENFVEETKEIKIIQKLMQEEKYTKIPTTNPEMEGNRYKY